VLVRLLDVAIDKSFERRLRTEVEQEPDFEGTSSQIIEQLFSVRRDEIVRRLDFDDYAALNNEVASKAANSFISVPDLEWRL